MDVTRKHVINNDFRAQLIRVYFFLLSSNENRLRIFYHFRIVDSHKQVDIANEHVINNDFSAQLIHVYFFLDYKSFQF